MTNETPKWRVLATAGFFGPDDTLYEEGAEIWYDGEPNEELEPLNQAAHDKLISYLERLDTLGREAAAKAGRPWAGRPRNLDGQLALATAVQKADMGILGAKEKPHTETVERAQVTETEDTALSEVKRKRGRPSLKEKPQKLSSAA
jgi:hypothetical protein